MICQLLLRASTGSVFYSNRPQYFRLPSGLIRAPFQRGLVNRRNRVLQLQDTSYEFGFVANVSEVTLSAEPALSGLTCLVRLLGELAVN